MKDTVEATVKAKEKNKNSLSEVVETRRELIEVRSNYQKNDRRMAQRNENNERSSSNSKTAPKRNGGNQSKHKK